MNYKILCTCGATCWSPGTEEPDANTVELSDNAEREWEGGDDTCAHADYSIVDHDFICDSEMEDWRS